MSEIYQEEENNQVDDLNIEADRVIAMNPSGVIEKFETRDTRDTRDVNGKKIHCDGNSCVILGDNEEVEDCVNGVCKKKDNSVSYTKYITYFVIFLAICALAYFLYKKYYCKS